MLLGLGMSGLQEFVYDVRAESAARRLRVRSAMLTLTPAVVACDLLRASPGATLLYLGGGKLLAQASDEAVAKAASDLPGLYRWLAESSMGLLGAYWTVCEDRDSRAGCVKALLAGLATAKWRAGRNGDWYGHLPIRATRSRGLGDEEWEAGQGALLARETGVVGFQTGGGPWEIGERRLRFATERPEIGIAGKARADVEVALPAFVPANDDGSVTLLGDLAQEGDGAPYLALLKLDGDGVGARLAQALDAPDPEAYFRESAALARFFGERAPELFCKEFPRVYLVYSGGDDLVATGHFDGLLRAAARIRAAYREAGLGTVSAGVSFYARNSPILKAVEAADQELARAKDARDAISIGGCALGWDAFQTALGEVDGMCEAIRGGSLNRGALQMLRQLGEAFLEEAPSPLAGNRLRAIPHLHYTRARRTEWRQEHWPPGVKALFDSLQTEEASWPRAALVGTLASWRTKRTEERS